MEQLQQQENKEIVKSSLINPDGIDPKNVKENDPSKENKDPVNEKISEIKRITKTVGENINEEEKNKEYGEHVKNLLQNFLQKEAKNDPEMKKIIDKITNINVYALAREEGKYENSIGNMITVKFNGGMRDLYTLPETTYDKFYKILQKMGVADASFFDDEDKTTNFRGGLTYRDIKKLEKDMNSDI